MFDQIFSYFPSLPCKIDSKLANYPKMTISVKNEHLCLRAQLIILYFWSHTMVTMVNNLIRKAAMSKFVIEKALKGLVQWSEARDPLMVYYLNFDPIGCDEGDFFALEELCLKAAEPKIAFIS